MHILYFFSISCCVGPEDHFLVKKESVFQKIYLFHAKIVDYLWPCTCYCTPQGSRNGVVDLDQFRYLWPTPEDHFLVKKESVFQKKSQKGVFI